MQWSREAGAGLSLGWRLTLLAVPALVGLYAFTVLTVPGQHLDDQIFGRAQGLGVGQLSSFLPFVARRALPLLMMLAVGLVAGSQLVRGRRRDVAIALVVPLISVPLSRWLRLNLPRPDHGYSYVDNTMPSTHATAVVAAAVAVGMLWPRERPAWLGWFLGAVTVVACLGNVVGHAHRPSDVLASVLLVIGVAGTVRGLSESLAHRRRE